MIVIIFPASRSECIIPKILSIVPMQSPPVKNSMAYYVIKAHTSAKEIFLFIMLNWCTTEMKLITKIIGITVLTPRVNIIVK